VNMSSDSSHDTELSPKQETPPRFLLRGFFVRSVRFEEVQIVVGADGESRPERIPVNMQIETHIVPSDPLSANVTMAVRLEPDARWQAYKVEVVVTGVFAGDNVSPELFNQFCKTSVPTILFPYVREIVHSVTKDALMGALRVDPVNVAGLVNKSPWVEHMPPPPPSPASL
jgi:preprotein translocase subunit SecB